MAEIDGGGGSTGGGDGNGDERPRAGEAEVGRPPIDDQTPMGASSNVSAEVAGSTGGGDGHAEGGGDGDGRCAPGELGRAPELTATGGPRVARLDCRSGVEGLVVTGLGLAEAGSSSGGGGSGDQSGFPPRDPASGKAPVVEEDQPPSDVHAGRVEFTPPVGSSSQVPTMSNEMLEFVGPDILARMVRENPAVVEMVMAAREERLREIARSDEEERLRREADGFARESEEAEREQEEGLWDRTPIAEVVEAFLGTVRAPFTAETYAPPEPHLFTPSGATSYVPRQAAYDAELVRRDLDQHVSRLWAEVCL